MAEKSQCSFTPCHRYQPRAVANYYYLTADQLDEVFLIRDRMGSVKVWRYQSPYPYESFGYLRANTGVLFFLEGAPCISVESYWRLHYSASDWQHFFCATGDSLVRLGKLIVLQYLDDANDESGIYSADRVERKVEITSNDEKYARIRSRLLESYFLGAATFDEVYLLSKDGLVLEKATPTKAYFVSSEEAKQYLNRVFEEYYSEPWRARAHEERARHFLPAFENLRKMRSDFAPAYYNLACMQALRGDLTPAIQHLRTAFELDQTYEDKAARDPDLQNLRGLPEFPALFE